MARIIDLHRDERMRYVLIFKNHGEEAGADTPSHSTSQLMALPITPRAIKNKLIIARDYFAEKERCIYCDVLQQELQERQRLIAESEGFVAFAPFASRFPFEMTVLPKSHGSAFTGIRAQEVEGLAEIVRVVLQKLDRALGSPPYTLSLHNPPRLRRREGYWTTIEYDFHWHFEILPQVFRITGLEWASGFFYNPVPPELAAQCLAETALGPDSAA
jgi:UDPglucose--hexose-1-phosphate uridylyltransferase